MEESLFYNLVISIIFKLVNFCSKEKTPSKASVVPSDLRGVFKFGFRAYFI